MDFLFLAFCDSLEFNHGANILGASLVPLASPCLFFCNFAPALKILTNWPMILRRRNIHAEVLGYRVTQSTDGRILCFEREQKRDEIQLMSIDRDFRVVVTPLRPFSKSASLGSSPRDKASSCNLAPALKVF